MKIVLLTPYNGTNLGDMAIQEAVIQNIRRRCSEADIHLVTLKPEKTSKLHGLSSFPMTSLDISYYFDGFSYNRNHISDAGNLTTGSEERKSRLLTNFKANIKTHPWLFSTLKWLYKLLLGALRAPGVINKEFSHIIDARTFMKGADMLLVSGGGQIDDYWGGAWGHPYSLFKWALIAKNIGARYVVLGVGTCSLESKLSAFFIRQALGSAIYRSYRDKISKELLKALKFTHDDRVCPDLAFSYKRKRLICRNLNRSTGKTIGISPITYLRQNWPKKDIKVYENYVANMVSFVKCLVPLGFSVIFFITSGPDRHAMKEIIDILANGSDIDLSRKIRQFRTETLDDLFDRLTEVDCVVASRLHGILLSNLIQKPVLAISYDRKVDTYMQDTGFSEYCLDIHNLSTDSLIKTFETMLSDAARIKSRLREICAKYDSLLGRQYDLMMEL